MNNNIKRTETLAGHVLFRFKGKELHNDEPNPAIIWSDGTLEFYNMGKRHSTTGPAVCYPDGIVEYWWENSLCSREDWLEKIKPKYDE